MKKSVMLVLAAVLLLAVICAGVASASNADESINPGPKDDEVKSATDLQTKLGGSEYARISISGDTVILLKDVNLAKALKITTDSSLNLALDLNGSSIYLTTEKNPPGPGAEAHRFATVEKNVIFTLTDTNTTKTGAIVGSSKSGETSNAEIDKGGCIFVEGGKFVLENGNITSCKAKNGGAVAVKTKDQIIGNFTMIGGNITECSATENGGAVFVEGGSSLLQDGFISGCSATKNGGAVVVQKEGKSSLGYFTMTGGSIVECNIVANEKALLCDDEDNEINPGEENGGGAVFVNEDCTFAMKGGSITDCCVISNLKLELDEVDENGNEINPGENIRCGGGVYVNKKGTFVLENGEISRCSVKPAESVNPGETKGGKGGGVYVNNEGSFTMKGGKISDCSVVGGSQASIIDFNENDNEINPGEENICCGGGVYVNNKGTFVLENGEISRCSAKPAESVNPGEAKGGNGGGVYVNTEGIFTMKKGNITGCSAEEISSLNPPGPTEKNDGFGGGIYVNKKGVFEMEGGKIADCNASSNGGGIYVESEEKSTSSTQFKERVDKIEVGDEPNPPEKKEYGVFNVSGSANITENTLMGTSAANNVYLKSTSSLNLIGTLTGRIGIAHPVDNGKFGTIFNSAGGAVNFISDVEGYTTGKASGMDLVWDVKEYDIFYVLNYGTNAEENPNSYNITSDIVLKNASKRGYSFEGWYNSSIFTEENKTNTISPGSVLNKTFYANYTVNITKQEADDKGVAEFSNNNETGLNPEENQVIRVVLENVTGLATDSSVTFVADNTSIDYSKIPVTDGYRKIAEIAIFEINIEGSGGNEFNVTVTLDDLNDKNKITFWHYNLNQDTWDRKKLTSEIIGIVDKNVTYKVISDTFSPFGISIETKNASPAPYVPSGKQSGYTQILQEGDVVPTVNPTAEPTLNPTVKPTTNPTQKSPAPFVGIIAGLGAALVLTRLRK